MMIKTINTFITAPAMFAELPHLQTKTESMMFFVLSFSSFAFGCTHSWVAHTCQASSMNS